MRISEWSSDVSSSDLLAGRQGRASEISLTLSDKAVFHRPSCRSRGNFGDSPPLLHISFGESLQLKLARRGDRKSAVSGKSVSIRVNLGVGRISKKQTTRVLHD